MVFLVMACKDVKDEKECAVPPPSFHLSIGKTASEYQDFLNDKGEADVENVYFYQITDNNTEKKYHTLLLTDESKNKDYAEVATENTGFLYTGKTETLYLKNKSKTYKIEFLGYLGECGSAHFQEMYIDGVKNNDFILVK
ncbi:hypothetical protein RCZ04_17570 [Capnocytophaga sp. HP1101]